MGLFFAWVLVACTALAAAGCAYPAWRLTRREHVAGRPGSRRPAARGRTPEAGR
jgi:hypothetical protein